MGILKHNIKIIKKNMANTHSHGDVCCVYWKRKKKPWIVNICKKSKKHTTIEFQFVALLIAIYNFFSIQVLFYYKLLLKPFTKHIKRQAIN